MPPLAVTISWYFTTEPAATVFASARFLSTMCGLGDGAVGVAGVTAGGVTTAGGGGVAAGGGGGGGGGFEEAESDGGGGGGDGVTGAGHTSVTVGGREPPLQVAPTVSVPKIGQVCVTAVCAGTVNCWLTPFTVSVETLSRPKLAL